MAPGGSVIVQLDAFLDAFSHSSLLCTLVRINMQISMKFFANGMRELQEK
jgi:hypothetical protein